MIYQLSNYYYVFTSKQVQCINTLNLIIGKSLTIMIHFQTWDQEGKWTQISWVCTYFELIFKLQKKEDSISFIFSLSPLSSLSRNLLFLLFSPYTSLCHFFFRIKAIITHFFSPLTSNYTLVWISLKNKNYFIIQLIFVTIQLTFATIHGFPLHFLVLFIGSIVLF